MKTFPIPSNEKISTDNQEIFKSLKDNIGFVPNLYAVFAHSDYALSNYLALQQSKSSINTNEREVIDLVVSQVNGCKYSLSAHTIIAQKKGFTEQQVVEIRKAEITFDVKMDALAKFVKSVVENKGHAKPEFINAFYAAGYNEGNLIDTVVIIGDRTITNYIYALTDVPIDWPLAPDLEFTASLPSKN